MYISLVDKVWWTFKKRTKLYNLFCYSNWSFVNTDQDLPTSARLLMAIQVARNRKFCFLIFPFILTSVLYYIYVTLSQKWVKLLLNSFNSISACNNGLYHRTKTTAQAPHFQMTFSLAWFKTFSRQNSLSFLKYAHPSLSRLFMKLAPHTLQSISMFAPPHYPVHLRIPPFYKFRGKLSLHSYSHYRFHFYILLNNLWSILKGIH